MNKEFKEKIANLTDNNAHTIARIEIAKHYEYLKSFEDIFHAINKIHEIEGSMPYHLGNYRNSLTSQMLDVIERKEGKEISESIYQLL